MKLGPTPPAVGKEPTACSSDLVPSSNPVRAATKPFIPLPRADQRVPSHWAMPWALTPPAVVKLPPAYSADLVPSSNPVRAATKPFIPLPRAAQHVPSHLAMKL